MKYRFATAAWRGAFVALCLAAAPSHASAVDYELVMFEQDGCKWCAAWDAEIGPAYPNTSEAEVAPLVKQDIHDPLPDTISLKRRAALTPTFVLIADGSEVGRIEGYPGANFFWPMLDEMLTRAGAALP